MPLTLLRDSPMAANTHPVDLWYEFMADMCTRVDVVYGQPRVSACEILATFKVLVAGRRQATLTSGEILDVSFCLIVILTSYLPQPYYARQLTAVQVTGCRCARSRTWLLPDRFFVKPWTCTWSLLSDAVAHMAGSLGP